MELEMKNKKERGFTLVELLTAMAVFSVIVIVVGGVVNSVMKAQRKTFSIQNAQEAGRFMLEMASKEIRTSLINTGDGSILPILSIMNAEGEILDYQFDNTNKRLLRDGEIVSPGNVEVTGGFYVNEYEFPSAPTRKTVTIVMKVRVAGDRVEQTTEMNLQNTIAPRSY